MARLWVIELGVVLVCAGCATDECTRLEDCSEVERCSIGRCEPMDPPKEPPQIEVLDGWDDRPGTGLMFVVDSLAIADRDRGSDLDGRCNPEASCCVDNILWPLGKHGNDQIRQGLLGGETMLGIEIAGIDLPYEGNDKDVTVKFYSLEDADEPLFAANNFTIPQGETKCCEFRILTRSLVGSPPQARSRVRGLISRGQLRNIVPAGDISFVLTVARPPHPEVLIRVPRIVARVPRNLDSLVDGLIGGALTLNNLAVLDNPYCATINPLCRHASPGTTLADLTASLFPLDIDLDSDGLETVVLGTDGRITNCYDGALEGEAPVAPFLPEAPWGCARRPQMQDGYSVGIKFSGVRARIVGIGDSGE